MKVYPLYPGRPSENLDGAWDFRWLGNIEIDTLKPDGIEYNDLMAVPGVFDTCPEYFGKRGVGVYRKKISFKTVRNSKLRLKIGALGLYAGIWWDNKDIGSYKLPYSGINYDFISDAGEFHELAIAVDNRFDKSRSPLFSPNFDFYAYGGIYRSIELQKLPDFYLERVQVTTLDPANGKVRLTIKLGGEVPPELNFSLSFDQGKKLLFNESVSDEKIVVEQTVPNFKIWSPESPNLHTVTVAAKDDSIVERFGIRTVTTEKQQIILNGKPIYLKGVNRHESHPEFGPVQSTPLMIEDLHLLKDLGCNFIRCVHYPQDQAFLDLCDEFGILVWQESMGWNNSEEDAVNPLFSALQINQTKLMVQNSINHPSVILWGFMNECCSETEGGKKLYMELSKTIKTEDPDFLVTYASSKKEKDLCFEFADVIAMTMYPGWIEALNGWTVPSSSLIEAFVNGKAAFTDREDLKNKPFIVAEIGVCALYGCHDRGKAQWSEEYQADYFEEACRCIMNNPRYAGLALWQMFDTRSYVNAGEVRGKPRGFNCAGLLDEYRRPKMAYDKVKEIYRS